MPALNIACLQMEIAKSSPGANLEKVKRFAARAKEDGADLLLLPEMWPGGFAYRELPRLARETPAILDELCRLAGENGLAVAGSMPEADGGKVYNTLYAVDSDGAVRARYRKVHLFPGFKEHLFIESGDKTVTVSLAGINVGLTVCFDLRFPELCRKLAIKGARLLIVSAQWPKERLDHWRVLAQARAVENQFFVAAVNNAGRHGKIVFAGHSLVVDPWGRVLAEAGEGEELLTAAVRPEEVDKARREVSYLSCRVKDTDEFLTLQ